MKIMNVKGKATFKKLMAPDCIKERPGPIVTEIKKKLILIKIETS